MPLPEAYELAIHLREKYKFSFFLEKGTTVSIVNVFVVLYLTDKWMIGTNLCGSRSWENRNESNYKPQYSSDFRFFIILTLRYFISWLGSRFLFTHSRQYLNISSRNGYQTREMLTNWKGYFLPLPTQDNRTNLLSLTSLVVHFMWKL